MADSNPRANTKTRVFTSFDFEHDEKLREFLVGQSRNPRSPFEIADWSLKEALPGDWKEKVRSRIRSVDVVLVICGEHTDRATGVSVEVRMAREEGKPVYFIKGRKDKNCKMPKAALTKDRMLSWTWDGLAAMLNKSAPIREIPAIRRERLSRDGRAWTEPPSPKPRTRRAPTIRAPGSTRAPVMRAPVMRAPVMRAPVMRAPVMRAPVIRVPVIRAPVIRAPVIRAPVIRAPVIRAPVMRAPVMRAPVMRAPVIRAPVIRTPVIRMRRRR